MARTGRVTTVVLGAFQVAANGDLANWNIPGQTGGGIGGAMDLAAGGARLIAVCYQLERDGRSKLVERLTYPPTALGCVRSVVTDLAWIDVDADGFLLRELAPGPDGGRRARRHRRAAAGGERRARDDVRLSAAQRCSSCSADAAAVSDGSSSSARDSSVMASPSRPWRS